MIHAHFQLFMIGFLCIASTAAQAKETSRIVPYPVDGRTAPEVFTYIKTKAPRVAPNATFAFTLPATKIESKSLQGKDGCRYTSFKTSVFFAYYIPEHKMPKLLPARTRKKWSQFVGYLKDHEKLHGANWTQCLADFDREALGLKAKDCRTLGAAQTSLFNDIKRACVAKDEAIDVVFRKEVMQHPFMREAQSQN
jgi:predicted secreted Zn-dependent protease